MTIGGFMYYCQCCKDPAIIVKKIRENFWPFKEIDILSYCKDCYNEIYRGKLPKVTNPTVQSKKKRSVNWRK
jgi:hypothetical protein